MTKFNEFITNCAIFACIRVTSLVDKDFIKEAETIIERGINGLFHTMSNSMLDTRDLNKIEAGFVISTPDDFIDSMKGAITARIHFMEGQEEFLQFVFKELKATGGCSAGRWEIKLQDGCMCLFTTAPMPPPIPVSLRKRAKVVKFVCAKEFNQS